MIKQIGKIYEPALDEEIGVLTLDELRQRVPTSDERRAIIARDALACVDGFRTIIQFVMEYLFGMRCCIRCPDCVCTDLFDMLNLKEVFLVA